MSKVKYIAEGGSSNKPPLFDGSNYYFWKGKMELFLKSQDNDMWAVITHGDFVPTKDGVVKEKSAWSTKDKAQVPHLFRKCNDVVKVIEEANVGEIVVVFNAPGFTNGLVSYTMTSIDVSESVSRDSDVQGKGDAYLPFVKVYGGKGRLVLMKSISGF